MYDVRWHAAGTGAARALEVHAADHLGVPARAVTSGRLCPRCGSSAHGRPWLRAGGAALHVSLSRSGPHLVTAVADGPVGVDVESVAAVARGWDAALVLSAGETADDDLARARAWSRKEAVLKRRGTGLATPMTEVSLDREQWHDLAAPAGHVAAVSWAGPAAPAP
ncbi:4'-phosphopantetheinyl transferase superfamily protein [Nocardioides sp. zg-1308]|uniref:4'-phosphopantetheinyl transferase superfamily protein n=1 Tax=Nocardioides renjunii TaxID=3095075 RepID=A0ABU5K8S1_9ACTN|nr:MULTISPECIES: 4'-phosphopantetheinyl transferase superfamily protein [unclassified Nocardioides]MDZ5661276.1 4'-phosphopantetheinyl transferase superfamily protein [Nocardioides sp. S-58]NPD04392.1 4'-phosphopantetheinyl transferase superfamily protein [Nocardioides sp. zg-1308]WQQ22279.1 4'-phosphopantetheinyl transferase superfamily protein [Nocardioides sp. S-34]